jgi:hypothetical protein
VVRQLSRPVALWHNGHYGLKPGQGGAAVGSVNSVRSVTGKAKPINTAALDLGDPTCQTLSTVRQPDILAAVSLVR